MLYKGDCLKVMPELIDQGVKVDMILCDLPYGTTACKWDTVIPFEPLWDCYKGLIKDNGAIVLFGSQPFTSALIMSNIKWFKYEWIWDKVIGNNPYATKYQPMRIHENICIFCNSKTKYNPILKDRDIKDQRPNSKGSNANVKKYNNTVWGDRNSGYSKTYDDTKINPKSILKLMKHPNSLGLHPTQKSVPLFEYLIRTYTNEGDLVLDNCAGSGTTAIACMNTSRKYICIEQDDKYFEVMKNRIEQHVVQLKINLDV